MEKQEYSLIDVIEALHGLHWLFKYHFLCSSLNRKRYIKQEEHSQNLGNVDHQDRRV